MTTKHTPEPWEVIQGAAILYGKEDPERLDGHRVAVASCSGELVPSGGFKYGQERDANAARIVACVNGCAGINPEAVPDLLAALEQLAEAAAILGTFAPELVSARAAIAKAKGE